mmetsp:Transcript_35326/g.53105  ORF Transcript_35326/g.53105 Transcript_35326/m.53105 type:complete len:159 (+) Transcript_35326:163-639(+)|eukprot:CAMPEP_0194773756 /NCGR_PEP_ID=MMETSP0323_2-20130528/55743_1 /TAXON_ID=2866 ORGANISM="Crypthecodinium cohnii, Strain Seligo" /NCGR_SAMPLE_ID=MMETSP0323_2 /ASSEMBLY_ACC=CAM_ASM_000346 /LENGTH=158 /DNA_ID=CAMNT_0039708969 /DNA_START=11 /DNA_END=487 /DNA_ORIENTATION=+
MAETTAKPTKLVMQTGCGIIELLLRPDSAPVTCDYIVSAVKQGLYDNKTFYRSDFVIQCGLHGSSTPVPPNLPVNETKSGKFISNVKGTCAIAHWDVPDCGNTEFFINIQDNPHLDEAYGGYCVFAQVADEASFQTATRIAKEFTPQKPIPIMKVEAV